MLVEIDVGIGVHFDTVLNVKISLDCTLRLTFYLPSADRLSKECKMLKINMMRIDKITSFAVITVVPVARGNGASEIELVRGFRVEESAMETADQTRI